MNADKPYHPPPPTMEDMGRFADLVNSLARYETRLERLALAYVIRNRAWSARGGQDGQFGNGTLASACRGFDASPVVSRPVVLRTLNDPDYCRDLALACRVWSGALPDPTCGATRFHTHHQAPSWAYHHKPTALIGNYFFYIHHP